MSWTTVRCTHSCCCNCWARSACWGVLLSRWAGRSVAGGISQLSVTEQWLLLTNSSFGAAQKIVPDLLLRMNDIQANLAYLEVNESLLMEFLLCWCCSQITFRLKDIVSSPNRTQILLLAINLRTNDGVERCSGLDVRHVRLYILRQLTSLGHSYLDRKQTIKHSIWGAQTFLMHHEL